MTGLLILAFGLVLILEGLAYALAPSLVERLLQALRDLTLDQRRLLGLSAVTLGVILVWLARALGTQLGV
ncbi:DUF2065 domain-containing protein [Pseudooceanicola nitratireducens]|uniref:DUF2065 domain-containing protein n=1 Tax=Pseudooceanicola nitratireducens TaxID=517719 RepID=UPI001C97EAE1|nr:DUF2065 domain-containing protein [Pseudooceanicola nitratireducens]MBY6156491.1 DUF2065 domain-containing protein [Pseudooceanicola nitratireducens]